MQDPSKTRPNRSSAAGADGSGGLDAWSVDVWTGAVNLQCEAWLASQADLLDTVHATMSTWLKRRREGTAATLRTMERASRSADPAEFATAYGEWLAGSVERLIADVASVREQTLALCGQTMEGVARAARSAAPEATAGPSAGEPRPARLVRAGE